MTEDTQPDLRAPQIAVDIAKEVLFRLENRLLIRRNHVRSIGLIAEHWNIERGTNEEYDKYLHRIINKIGESR